MSDELLQRAAKALREEADGHGSAGLPRLAILQKIEANRRASAQRWAVGAPLVLLLATSTAIAAATGVLPVAWQKVKQLVAPAEVSLPTPAAATAQAPATGNLPGRGPRRSALPVESAPAAADAADSAPEVAAAAAPAAVLQAPSIEPAQGDPQAGAAMVQADQAKAERSEPPKAQAPAAAARRLTAAEPVEPPALQAAKSKPAQPVAPPQVAAPTAAPEPPAAAPAAPDPLQPFRAAQRLQFKDKNWAAALAAWDAYLRQEPHGALAPEARWNRAICLVRLERTAEARQALRPFAQGEEGGYRQAQAHALLQELGQDQP